MHVLVVAWVQADEKNCWFYGISCVRHPYFAPLPCHVAYKVSKGSSQQCCPFCSGRQPSFPSNMN